MKNYILIPASLVVLALSACGGDSKKSAPDTTTTPPPVTATQPAVTQPPATQQSVAAAPTVVANSLCNANEKVLFNCQINTKTVSVCASSNLSKNNGYLQYRFGTKAQADLVYPQTYSQNSFSYNGQDLSFNKGSIKYQVYTQGSAGIQTFWEKAPSKNKTYPCNGSTVTNQLQQLNGVLN